MRLLSLFILAAFAAVGKNEKKRKEEREILKVENERLKQERKERKEERKSQKAERELKKTNIARTIGADSDYFGITVDSEVPGKVKRCAQIYCRNNLGVCKTSVRCCIIQTTVKILGL